MLLRFKNCEIRPKSSIYCTHTSWCIYHEVTAGDGSAQDGVTLSCDEFETFSNLLLRVAGYGTDLLEGARNFFLATGYVETGCGHRVVCPSFQMLLFVDLLEQGVAAILQ